LSGYIFDGNGNPTTYSGKNLAFDIENRLVSITSPAFAAAYAPDDRRASKTANGATTYYLYDEAGGASPLLEEQGTGTVSMGYGMAGDGLRARYAPQSGGLYYLFQWDPQGSLVQRQTGGPGGNTSYYALDTAMFDGYGAKLGDTDAFTGNAETQRDAMGFQGQFGAYTDTETGLVLMGHRYYDAGTGRFLTRDPKGYSGGINLYGFTGNNPVNEMDPDGTDSDAFDPNAYFNNLFSYATPKDVLHALVHNDVTHAVKVLFEGASYIPLPENPVADAKVAEGAVEGAEFVYRVIRADEVPGAGLVAKDALADYSVHAHVSNGSRLNTQFISTTKSLDVAMFYAKRDGLRVVKINLNKVHGAEIIDLTNPVNARQLLHHPIPRGLANASQEVLIKGKIPASALSVIHTP